MKYKVGDVVKTIKSPLEEKTEYIQWYDRVGIITSVYFPSRPNPLYKVLIAGTNNRTVCINENEIKEKL